MEREYEKISQDGWMLVKKSDSEYAVIGYENGQCKMNGYFASGNSDESIDYVVDRWVSKGTATRDFNRLVGTPGKRRF